MVPQSLDSQTANEHLKALYHSQRENESFGFTKQKRHVYEKRQGYRSQSIHQIKAHKCVHIEAKLSKHKITIHNTMIIKMFYTEYHHHIQKKVVCVEKVCEHVQTIYWRTTKKQTHLLKVLRGEKKAMPWQCLPSSKCLKFQWPICRRWHRHAMARMHFHGPAKFNTINRWLRNPQTNPERFFLYSAQ